MAGSTFSLLCVPNPGNRNQFGTTESYVQLAKGENPNQASEQNGNDPGVFSSQPLE
jgi:hypothetical protein